MRSIRGSTNTTTSSRSSSSAIISNASINNRFKSSAALLLLTFSLGSLFFYDDILGDITDHDYNSNIVEQVLDVDNMASNHLRHRNLLSTLGDSTLMNIVDSSLIRNASAAFQEEDSGSSSSVTTTSNNNNNNEDQQTSSSSSLPPYTLIDTIGESTIFESAMGIIIYDPSSDKFNGYFTQSQQSQTASHNADKVWKSMEKLVSMLRLTFPERFRGKGSSEEFVIGIASGDYPHVLLEKLPHTNGVAPILMFGSSFRDTSIYPNMMVMPSPDTGHLDCFEQWSRLHSVCGTLRPVDDIETSYKNENWYLELSSKYDLSKHEVGKIVYENELHLGWDDLIPQVLWRGSDFDFLPNLRRPMEKRPFDNEIEQAVVERRLQQEYNGNRKKATARGLRAHYDTLLPRWKGTVLTAEAELEVQSGEVTGLPWANIKFSRAAENGVLAPTVGSATFKQYDEVGVASGNIMAKEDILNYKYQIDLGGGGGTTPTTVDKLAMPGLLFHHVTPTKDYIHDRMKPWKHYIPVATDLRDLHDKFVWAENHPNQAKRIAKQATGFMRHLGTTQGMQELFKDQFVTPFQRIINAYRPVSMITNAGGYNVTNYKDILKSLPEGNKMIRVMECLGTGSDKPISCHAVDGDNDEEDDGDENNENEHDDEPRGALGEIVWTLKNTPGFVYKKMFPPKKVVCPSRPIMHTFFDTLEAKADVVNRAGMTDDSHQKLIDVWSKSWQDAGFDTRVLTKEDAMKHPEFEWHHKKLLELGVNDYNQLCFWRWIAMAAIKDECQDGGWMSDYDTFPLSLTAEEALEIEMIPGFKSYSKHVPNLIHSDSEHWIKLLRKLVRPPDMVRRKQDDTLPERQKSLVTDMLALKDVTKVDADGDFVDRDTGITVFEYESTGMIYALDETTGNLVIDCVQGMKNKVSHLSHGECRRALDAGTYTPLEGEVNEDNYVDRRPEAAIKMIEDFHSKCLAN